MLALVSTRRICVRREIRTGFQQQHTAAGLGAEASRQALPTKNSSALVADLKCTITDDRYPLSPRIRALQVILDKLPAAGPPASTRKSTSPKINYNTLQL